MYRDFSKAWVNDSPTMELTNRAIIEMTKVERPPISAKN